MRQEAMSLQYIYLFLELLGTNINPGSRVHRSWDLHLQNRMGEPLQFRNHNVGLQPTRHILLIQALHSLNSL